MREIKFRLWQDNEMRLLDTMMVGAGELGFSDTFYIDINEDMQEQAVIMQYTGLKDKNGVEIYEGDIVVYSSINFTGEVRYFWMGRCGYNVVPADEDMIMRPLESTSDLEVIGNIYENPELLK